MVDFWIVVLRAPGTWNGQTLKDLEILPLYLTRRFYKEFDRVCHVTNYMSHICVHFKILDNVQRFVCCTSKSNR